MWKIKAEAAFKVNGLVAQLDLVFKKGHVNLIYGENGVGKTSFFRYMKEKQSFISENKCVFMDQFPLAPLVKLKVKDVLSTICEELSNTPFDWKGHDAYSSLGIDKLEDKNVEDLSGGENQKLKFFMTLLQKAHSYFLDEPFQFLDKETQKYFRTQIAALSEHSYVIVIEHNREVFEGVRVNLSKMSLQGERLKLEAYGD